MANTQTVGVLQNPDLSIPAGATGTTGVTMGIQNQFIDSVTAATALNCDLVKFPGALAIVAVRYFKANQQLTGNYIISSAAGSTTGVVAAIISNSGGILQSVHVVQFASGSAAPGSGGAGTVYGISNLLIDQVLAATAKQIVTYPNALTQINKRFWSNSAQSTGTMIVTEAVAAVITAS